MGTTTISVSPLKAVVNKPPILMKKGIIKNPHKIKKEVVSVEKMRWSKNGFFLLSVNSAQKEAITGISNRRSTFDIFSEMREYCSTTIFSDTLFSVIYFITSCFA
jgi:hypothetical protein